MIHGIWEPTIDRTVHNPVTSTWTLVHIGDKDLLLTAECTCDHEACWWSTSLDPRKAHNQNPI